MIGNIVYILLVGSSHMSDGHRSDYDQGPDYGPWSYCQAFIFNKEKTNHIKRIQTIFLAENKYISHYSVIRLIS